MSAQRHYGVGVEWAEKLESPILDNLDRFSLIELIPENFFHDRRTACLEELKRSGAPVMVHGVELSLGTDEPLKEKHLEKILRVADQVNTINISDHLCFTEAGQVEIGQLTPLPRTRRSADLVCRKIEQVRKRIEVPFLIENITNRFEIPGQELTEPEFINFVTSRTGCNLLIDMNNIHTNAFNFGFDPYGWIDAIDLDTVMGVHLAGGYCDDEGSLIDSHSAQAPERVWKLYRYLCERIVPSCTIVEWTDDPPPIDTLIREVEIARGILEGASVRKAEVAS
jgi:uncharacterized protein (UPF0276 family)